MGQHFTKAGHTFLTECQSQLTQLDEMLLGVVSSVDSLHITITQLLNQLQEMHRDNIGDGTENTCIAKQRNIENLELTRKLLSSVEDGLCHQKTTLLQEISQFVRLIKTRSDPGKPISKSIPAIGELKIDTYLSTGKISEFTDKSKITENGKVQGQQFQEKTSEESGRVITSLEKEKKQIMEQIKTLTDKNQQFMKENDELKKRITKLEAESIQLVPVQLYCQTKSDQMGMVLQEIMTQLSGKERFGNKRLAFIVCEQASDINPKMPVLALCFNASRLGTDARNAIQEIKQANNTALLILHHKDEHALPKHNSDRVLIEPEFKALGGIFDLAFLAGKGIYLCERNTVAIESVMTFLKKVLEGNPLEIKKA